MTFPSDDKDWLIADPSFKRSPVAPVESALSLKAKNENDNENDKKKWKCLLANFPQ